MRIKSLTVGMFALALAAALELPGSTPALAGDPPSPPPAAAPAAPTLDDQHNVPTNAVSGNVTFLDNVRGVSGYSSLNFIHYSNYGDFMFANGTGGLAIWSLKDPKHPALVSKVTAAQLRLPGDTQDRFWEGENLTIDSKRKLVLMTRDPRGFGGTVSTGQSGLYVVDVKNPWQPKIGLFHPVPAGHTATCINDCKYVWSVGPISTGTPGNNFPDWKGVPVWVTDLHDPQHPHTFSQPIDLGRFDGETDYVHSVDVDKNGVAWTSGEGGVRGYWTKGLHFDPVQKRDRVATAYDPVPYAGGMAATTHPGATDFFDFFEHNSYHNVNALGGFGKGELLYITNENITTCSQAGELRIASLKGSFDGESWRSTPENPFRLNLISHWSAWGKEGSSTTDGTCSAHWFTVNGNILAQGWYGQGVRFIDVSDPRNPKQVGFFRVPQGDPNVIGGSASAAYWHNGLVYVADYNRGVDVLRFDGKLAGPPDKIICWNSCDK